MKQTLLITTLFACSLSAHAQQMQASSITTDQTTTSTSTPANMTSMSASSPMDVFAATTMDMNNNVVRFSNMPNCTVKAYITDANGQLVSHCKLTAEKNTIDVSRMDAGLYYVTLFDKSKRRSFKIVR